MTMTLEQAKELLAGTKREELRDHAFGDCEVYWNDANGEEVASGYFGTDVSEVGIGEATFTGTDAVALRHAGTLGGAGRNDSTGPDEWDEVTETDHGAHVRGEG